MASHHCRSETVPGVTGSQAVLKDGDTPYGLLVVLFVIVLCGAYLHGNTSDPQLKLCLYNHLSTAQVR